MTREAEKQQMTQMLSSCLSQCSGVIHIGASTGQEREFYNALGLNVIWVEPLPKTFNALLHNIEPYPNQRAYQYLVTNIDNEKTTFHVYSHDDNKIGAQSSIFNFQRTNHPKIHHVEDLVLTSVTLPTMIAECGIGLDAYDALVMDTQGSELLILQGAGDMLHAFKYICSEASVHGTQYKSSCTLDQISSLLSGYNFKSIYEYSHTPGVRFELDVIFERQT